MALFIFILTTLSFALIGNYILNKKQKVHKRIERFINLQVQAETRDAAHQKKTPLNEMLQRLAKNVKPSLNKRNKLEIELTRAGVPLKVEEFITINLVLLAFTTITSLFLGIHVILAIILGLIASKLPSVYLKKKQKARLVTFGDQLPQALETMANAMKSGFSFMQALQLVSKELPDPIGIEFQRTIKEINLGIPLDTAFENLLERIPNKDLEIVVTAVLIQRSTGGNLAKILETIHETISVRVRMKDELKALTSQGRMSALVITLLPVLLGVALNLLNPDYFKPMFSHPLGWVLLGSGVISGLMGWIFIQKVVTIEV